MLIKMFGSCPSKLDGEIPGEKLDAHRGTWKGCLKFQSHTLLPLLSKVIEKVSISLVFEKKAFYGFDKGLMTSMTLIGPKNVFATIDHVVLLKILHAIWFLRAWCELV